MANSVCAHIDCNNFYASCERAFSPSLRDRPLAILSNNDGCIIARSQEAKEAGIEMGAPLFKQKQLIEKEKIAVRSSNYALYGDMSRRVMQTLRHLTHHVEPYSIDEAFIEFPRMPVQDLTSFGRHIRSTILQWTGLPVSVGIAPSKTLAKIANEKAKARPRCRGVLNLVQNPDLNNILQQTNVSEIWGIGSGLSQRLYKEDINTALELKQQINRRDWVKNRLNITGLRTVMELNGKACLNIEQTADPRKGIMTSRSFGQPVTRLEDLQEAVAEFISIAAEKLRAQHSVASLLHLKLRTSKYTNNARYKYGIEIPLPNPTGNTSQLIKYGKAGLQHLYNPKLKYKKAAVMLTGIVPETEVQTDLFNNKQYSAKEHRLMQKVDDINTRYGTGATHFASTGIEQPWQMRQKHLSSKYTTQWPDLMKVHS